MTPEQFLQLADLLPDALLMLSAEGTILAANQAAAAQWALAPGQLVGRSLADCVADSPQDLAAQLTTWSRTRSRLPGALVLRRGDGANLACRCEGGVLRPGSGPSEAAILLRLIPKATASPHFVVLNQKIDELSREVHRRRQAEGELRGQREWLRVTLSSIGDAVIVTDTEGKVTFLNPTAEALTGWPEEVAIGLPLDKVFHIIEQNSRLPVENPTKRVLREGILVGLANHTMLVARDGHERPIDDCAAPIRAEDGRVVGAVLVFHDVTERRQLERELHQRAERLAEAGRRKDGFLAMLAHELRNPLAPVLNGLRVLELSGSDQVVTRQIRQMMERQIRHLIRIVDDLLEVSRITQGKVTLRRERLDLARLVRVAVQDRRLAYEQVGLELCLEGPHTPLWVNGDATRLTQVLDNLLDNAAKFTPRGGTVTVRLGWEAGSRQACLKVMDTGEGIDPSVLPNLFEPFSQADHSLERARGGLGLGLALVRGLIRLHGGEAQVSSRGPGQGAEFTILLPLAGEPLALLPRPVTEPPAPGQLQILIVEDNQDAADSMRMFLELLGHKVTVVHTGPEGVRAATTLGPAVVLCDIGLPGLDGYGVARELRQNPTTAKTRLIAISGYAGEEDRRRSREAGFDFHLGKPADPDTLLRLLP